MPNALQFHLFLLSLSLMTEVPRQFHGFAFRCQTHLRSTITVRHTVVTGVKPLIKTNKGGRVNIGHLSLASYRFRHRAVHEGVQGGGLSGHQGFV